MSEREQQRLAFALAQGASPDGWHALPADASTRRYFRLASRQGPCLLMDVATPGQGFHRYIEIAQHLVELGYSAPRVHAADRDQGLALIEDFGDATYTRLLAQGEDEAQLYELAIDTLAALHQHARSRQVDLPAYDLEKLLDEALLFAEWFAPPLLATCEIAAFRTDYESIWRAALADVANRRDVLVLRDYHVDNLIFLPQRSGVARCGLLDFQDGLIGSAAYDVMSLTQDARRDLYPKLEAQLLRRYFDARPGLNQDVFMQDFHLLAAQRHAKVAGIFQRLAQRDGKHQYLQHIPRVLGLLKSALHKAELSELSALLEHYLNDWEHWVFTEIIADRG